MVKKKRVKPLHFESDEAYRKWQAYRHIHHIKTKHPNRKVYIAGKPHRVKKTKK